MSSAPITQGLPPPTAADLYLEQRIESAQTALALAPRARRRAAFEELRRLVRLRSPDQIARMEVSRGLRR